MLKGRSAAFSEQGRGLSFNPHPTHILLNATLRLKRALLSVERKALTSRAPWLNYDFHMREEDNSDGMSSLAF